MYKSCYKIVSKFVEKLLKCGQMDNDILTFLGLGYRDASLITCNGHSGNDYRDATLSKLN